MNIKAGHRPGVTLCEALEARRLLAAGDQDLAFGGDGSFRLGANVASSESLLPLANDQVLVVTTKGIQRRNADGSLDASFGSGGTASLGRPGESFYGSLIARLMTDGKIVVAGADEAGHFLLRFNPGGSRDASFGNNGIINLATLGEQTSIDDFAVAGDGKIIAVGGLTGATIEDKRTVYRLNTSGTLDPTFTPYVFLWGFLNPLHVALQSTGKILVGSDRLHTLNFDEFDMVRLSTTGSVDTTFASAGYFHDVGMEDFLVLSDDRIVTATAGGSDWTGVRVARISASGQLDPAFGSPGDGHSDTDLRTRIVPAGGGKYLVYGSQFIYRTGTDGKPDSSFGYVVTHQLPDPRYGYSPYTPAGAATLSDGNILLAADTELFRIFGSGSTPSFARIVGSTLIIDGSPAADNIELYGALTDDDLRISIRREGAFGRAFPAADFWDISVNTATGDDHVNIYSLRPQTVLGGEGNDDLSAGYGPATVHGGNGDDTLSGNLGSTVFFGDAGDDSIYANSGNDTLYGGDGKDTLQGEDGDDQLFGDAGDDSLEGGFGSDQLNGGDGDDTFESANDGTPDQVYGDAGAFDTATAERIDTLNGIELPKIFSSGKLDTSFGDDGIAGIPLAGFTPTTLTGARKGGYYIGGHGTADLIRLTSGFELDPTFGTGGIVNTRLSYVSRVEPVSGGCAEITGYRRRTTTSGKRVRDYYKIRLNLDGSVRSIQPFSVDPTNVVYVAASYYYGSYYDVVSWNNDILYTSGGSAVRIKPPGGARSIAINDAVVAADSLHLSCTATWEDGQTRLTVVKISPTGVIDTSFGKNGYLRPFDVSSNGEHITTDGNTLYATGRRNGRTVVVAYNTYNGDLQSDWGTGGIFTAPDLPQGYFVGTDLRGMLLFGSNVIVGINAHGQLDEEFGKVIAPANDVLLFSDRAVLLAGNQLLGMLLNPTPAPESILISGGTLHIDGTASDDPISVVLDTATAQVIVNTRGYGRIITAGSFSNIAINASEGNDNIDVRLELPTTINAGGGDDMVWGGLGPDLISGGDGNDRILGHDGNDTVFGGAGDDNIDGGSGDDSLLGDLGRDKLTGRDGDDRLFGGAGGDFLHGMAGNDLILGEGGDDYLFGEEGADSLDGGAGNNFLASD